MLETLQGRADQEQSTQETAVRARNAALAAQGRDAQGGAPRGRWGAALSRLIARAGAYPDLKANKNFQHLQGELSDVENMIAPARRFLNKAVAEYNVTIEGVPGVLISGRFGFEPLAYFGVDNADS